MKNILAYLIIALGALGALYWAVVLGCELKRLVDSTKKGISDIYA